VATRTYGQYCGLVRAAELVGERWALLILRDLLVGPKRFTDLERGLPGIPTNVLTARLKELERAGVVHRRALPRPAGGVAYELTAYGAELEDIVKRLGRWGAKLLGNPRPGETVTPDSLVMALRSTFDPEAARGLCARYELRLGELVLHADVDNGELEAAQGAIADPDLVIEPGPSLKALMTGELRPADAIKNGDVRITGDPKLLERFVRMFHIDPMS